ncbi:MAG: ATP-binding protein [Deferribacteraceae bacterium]|jgi:anti-sigma regulatory factor (Ser/Thr protein kinase)|nr:ATP-binding protein [Deferribacteraceae bacterium]
MKRIAYRLLEKECEEALLNFCKNEDITAVAVEEDGNTERVLLYITDELAAINYKFPGDTKKCLISDSDHSAGSYYTLNRNFTANSLKQLMDEIFHGGRLWNMVKDITYISSVKEIVVGNSVSDVDRFVCLITEDIIHFCDYSTLEKVRVGLSEMITNAIEHGNLNISSEEKHEATEAGVFRELVKARMEDARYKDRVVRCRAGIFPDRADFIISDEGNGFDTSKLPKPDDTECLLNLHGRGIYITQAYFDKVSYNDKGNTVYMVKKF